MLRIRTFFGNKKIKFDQESLSFAYGASATGNYTEYGTVIGYDSLTTVNNNSYYVIKGGAVYETNPATCNFKTTKANQTVTVTLVGSSQSGDYICVGALDSNSITKAAAKTSGTNTVSYTYTVPTAGDHYIKIFLRNDGSGTGNSNSGYFRLTPFTNSANTITTTTKELTIKSGTDWSLSSKPSWITVSPISGSKGSNTIEVTAAVNTTASTRTGKLVFISGNKEYSVDITQGVSVNTIKASRNTYYNTYEANSDTFTVSLTGNTSWTSSKTGSFYSISPTTGSNGTEVTITWNKSSSTSQRSGVITLTGNLEGTDTVKVYQEPYICSCDCQNNCYSETFCNTDYTNDCTSHCSANCGAKEYCCGTDGTPCSCEGYKPCDCNEYSPCSCNSKVAGCTCQSVTCSCDNDSCTCDAKTAEACDCKQVCESEQFIKYCQKVTSCWPYELDCVANCIGYGYDENYGIYDTWCGNGCAGAYECYIFENLVYCAYQGQCIVYNNNVCEPVFGDGYCSFVETTECVPDCWYYCPEECIANVITCTSHTACVCNNDNSTTCPSYDEDGTCNVVDKPCTDCSSDTVSCTCNSKAISCTCNGVCNGNDGCYDCAGCNCNYESRCTTDATDACKPQSTCNCYNYTAVS